MFIQLIQFTQAGNATWSMWKHNLSYRKSIITINYSLVNAMASRCDPPLVDDGTATTMRAGESEERGTPNRHLPRPSTERRILAAHDTRFWTAVHRG